MPPNRRRETALVVRRRGMVAALLHRVHRIAHDHGSAGEIEHLDIIQVVADRHDVGSGHAP